MNVAVIGCGAWGTALSLQLHKNGHKVYLWGHDEQLAEQMRQLGESPMLKGVKIPEGIVPTGDDTCVQNCQLIIFVSASVFMESVCRRVAPYIPADAVLVSATKGIDYPGLKRMTQIIEEITGKTAVALSGPSHAEEVALNIPTGLLAASPNKQLAEFVQDAFMSDTLRVYTSPDVVGAELGGALKNVIALCAGVIDGLGYGDNTGAMLATRGLTEIARLGVAMGAQKETFAGLAGIGDLIVTCTSQHSRNRRAGVLIGKGATAEAAMEQVGAVVEGYYAARSAMALAQLYHVDMPITAAAYAVLYEGVPVEQVVHELLLRQRRPESEDAGWL